MWQFLGDMHAFDSNLAGESRVFSYIPVGTWHVLVQQRTIPRGNREAPVFLSWAFTFLTTGYPYKIPSALSDQLCEDVPHWYDMYGHSCNEYVAREWCNASGIGPGWFEG